MMDYLDVRRDDINYAHLYGDAKTLMDNAARQLSGFIRKKFKPGSRICAVCGTGNNAGDGIAALEDLRKDYEVSAVLVKGRNSIRTEEAKWALKQYGGTTSGIRSLDRSIRECDVILDCLFGIGISGDLREPYPDVIDKINRSGKTVVSVDVPSGLGTGKAVKPHYTVTFTDQKRGMDSGNSGEITVCDIGIPDSVRKYAGPGDMVYYVKPDPASHKGMNGSLSVIAGWEFYGSSVIAGLGANALATDLVRIYTTAQNYHIIASYSPYLIVRNITAIGSGWKSEALKSNAILAGPGLGTSREAGKELMEIMRSSNVPIVIDADGIRLVSEDLKAIWNKKVILTPHRREFEILTGMNPDEENAALFARKHSVVIVLKGPVDIVTDGERTIYVEGGNVRMTMGGTGDLLAGFISALASRGIEPFRAAVMGAYINKKTAETSYSRKSYWYTIDDMIRSIPEVMKSGVKWA